ncbi:MAG: TraI/MobA(P) family conjugative relaxase [Gammaproteobacteria bacterium]
MIAKHFPMKIVRKSNFGTLVKYITDTQEKHQRVGEIQITNCHSTDVDWAIQEVKATQAKNTRAESDKNYHLLLSFAPGEVPSPEVLIDIEARVCASIGYKEHQRVSAIHHDTDSLHIHLAINKIHPERLTLHEPYRAYKILGDICTILEIEHGLQRVDHSARKQRSQNKADDMEHAAGIESLIGWVQRECLKEIQDAQNWKTLHQALQKNGLEIQLRGNGFVITDQSGMMVKASSVSRNLSKKNLESRFGLFEAATHKQGRAEPSKKYTTRPMPSRINTVELYARYKDEQSACNNFRSNELAKEREKKNRLIKAAKQIGTLKRAAIKLMVESGPGKKIQYALCSRQLQIDIQKISQQYLKDRNVVYEKYQRSAWNDWLKKKAIAGDKEALLALRSKSERQFVTGNTMSGSAAKSGDHSTSGINPEIITKNGTLIYHVGASAVRDDGDRLSVARGSTQEGLEVALRMAMRRYGERITVNGTAEFKEKIVQVAIAFKLPVVFNDAELENRRKTLLQGAGSRDSIRTGQEAVDKFIAERESKRLKGLDIPKYRQYQQGDKGAVNYAGTRQVGGQFLALLKKDEWVIVIPINESIAKRMKGIAVGDPVTLMQDGSIKTKGRSR